MRWAGAIIATILIAAIIRASSKIDQQLDNAFSECDCFPASLINHERN